MILSSIAKKFTPFSLLSSYFSPQHSIASYSNVPIKIPSQLIENCKGLIFDMDGVLRIGDKPILDANKIIQTISNKQIPTMIITNECRRTPRQIRKDLNNMGLNIPTNWHIISASYLCKQYLHDKLIKDMSDMKKNPHKYSTFKIIKHRKKRKKIYNKPKISVGVIADTNLFNYLKSKINILNIELISALHILNKDSINMDLLESSGQTTKNHFSNQTRKGNNYHTKTKFKYIVIGSITRKKIRGEMIALLNLSKHWIRTNPDAEVILTSPDRNDPENNITIENILPSIIWDSIWEDKTYTNTETIKNKYDQYNFECIDNSEIKFTKYMDSSNRFYQNSNLSYDKKEHNNLYICGKPNINIKNIFMDTFKLKTEEDLNDVILVGDNPETDIKLSNSINSKSVLVLSGILSSKEKQLEFSKQDLDTLQKCRPNYIINNISELI